MNLNWIAIVGLLTILAGGCRTVQRSVLNDVQECHASHSIEPKAEVAENSSAEDINVRIAEYATAVVTFQEDAAGEDSASKFEKTQDESSALGRDQKAIVRPVFEAESHQFSSGVKLSELEALALANNPAIQELEATTRKAAGFRTQVGLQPNPTAGYQAVQLADQQTDQHTLFVEQEFVRGGKLELNRQVLNETLRAQSLELEAQKLRVATDVRIKFYEALGAQQRMQLIAEFRTVVDKGLAMSEQLVQAGEATKIDVIQSRIQQNEIELAEQQAQFAFESAWRELVAIAGTPDLAPTPLVGVLPDQVQSLAWDAMACLLVESSPEYSAAQVRICRAKANLRRQGVQSIPNITAQLAAGYDNATNSGLINLQVGAPIPIHNWNQGNIAAAQAEYCRAVRESERIENAIRARLAAVAKDFDSSLAALRTYRNTILPAAQESLDLVQRAYQEGETSFVQVLVARKTYFDSNLQYVIAQTQLAQAQAKIEGNLLTGGLDPVRDDSGDDSLRGLTFSQQ